MDATLLDVYTDWNEFPLDENLPPDRGDAGPQPKEDEDAAGDGHRPPSLTELHLDVSRPAFGTPLGLSVVHSQQSIIAGGRQAKIIVPFGRPLKKGSKGDDVIAVKRALSTWNDNIYPWQKHWSPTLGDLAVRAMKEFQHHHGIEATGKMGPPTLRALAPFFDRYGFELYTTFDPPHPDPTVAIRKACVSECLWAYAHRGDWHYRQSRPIDGLHVPFKLPIYTDCSGGCTDVLAWAHGPDPNGNNWNGQGYTGTIAAHCRRIRRDELQAGDMGVYGNAPGYEHVVMALGEKRDGVDICWSNGSEGGPYIPLINYRGSPDLCVTPFAKAA